MHDTGGDGEFLVVRERLPHHPPSKGMYRLKEVDLGASVTKWDPWSAVDGVQMGESERFPLAMANHLPTITSSLALNSVESPTPISLPYSFPSPEGDVCVLY